MRKITLLLVLLAQMPAWAAPKVQQWDGDQLVGRPHAVKATPKRIGKRVFRMVRASAAPVLGGLDLAMAPPGATLTITGSNFSPNPAENKVMFGNVEAQVTAASRNSLSVTVPGWSFGPGQLGIPITVITKGVPSANALRFDIGAKYIPPTEM